MNINKHKLAATIGAALAAGTLAAQAAEVKMKFGAQVDYYDGDAGTLNTDGNLTNNVVEHEFIVRRARLYFDGKVNDVVSGTIGLQADDSGSTGGRDGALKDAYINLKFHKLAMVRAGTYKYEFDLEGRESSFVRPFMDRSIATNAVAGQLTGAGGDFRDKGVSLLGMSDHFGYGVGLWQGMGADARDNNDKFGYTANVWAAIAGLKANLGYMDSDNTPLESAPLGAGVSRTDQYMAATAGLAWEGGPFLVRGEIYDGERDIVTGATATPSTQDIKGYYVMGVFTPVSAVDLMVRFQQFEDDKWGTSNNEVTSTDLGVKYYFERKGRGGSNFSLNYMIRDADGVNTTTGVTQKIFDERGGNVTGTNIGDVVMARLQVEY